MNKRVLHQPTIYVKPDFATIRPPSEMHAYLIAWVTATLRFDPRGLATSRRL